MILTRRRKALNPPPPPPSGGGGTLSAMWQLLCVGRWERVGENRSTAHSRRPYKEKNTNVRERRKVRSIYSLSYSIRTNVFSVLETKKMRHVNSEHQTKPGSESSHPVLYPTKLK
jgi:hypothetical protein